MGTAYAISLRFLADRGHYRNFDAPEIELRQIRAQHVQLRDRHEQITGNRQRRQHALNGAL